LDNVEVDKNIILDATKSTHPDSGKELKFMWDFGDGNKKEGVEVVHTYATPGARTITLAVSDGVETVFTQTDVFVYKKIILFVTNKSEIKDKIDGFKNHARDREVDIVTFSSYDSFTEFIAQEELVRKLSESIDQLKKIDQIIVWTDGTVGLDALFRVMQEQNDPDLTFEDKTILIVSDGDASLSSPRREYNLLKPKHIVSAKEGAVYPFIESENAESYIEGLEKNGYEYSVLDKDTGSLKLWNFMSYFVNYMIDSGIPANTIILILLLPVIATIVAFMKQIVGITTFGVYTPTIITLTFWMLGIKFGLVTLILTLIIGTSVRYILKRFRLLYIPRMAIVLTTVALAIFALLIITINLNLFNTQYFSLAIFPMLILSTLTEKFISVQTDKGFKRAFILTFETVFVAILAYIAIGGDFNIWILQFKWSALQNLLLSFPEIIIFIIFINIFLGRWTGLRLLEYVRFREVLRHVEEE